MTAISLSSKSIRIGLMAVLPLLAASAFAMDKTAADKPAMSADHAMMQQAPCATKDMKQDCADNKQGRMKKDAMTDGHAMMKQDGMSAGHAMMEKQGMTDSHVMMKQ